MNSFLLILLGFVSGGMLGVIGGGTLGVGAVASVGS